MNSPETVSWHELFARIEADDLDAAAATIELRRRIVALAQHPVPVGKRGERVLIPEEDREDVAEDVFLAIWTGCRTGTNSLADVPEEAVPAYVGKMLGHRWLDILRRRREALLRPDDDDRPAPPSPLETRPQPWQTHHGAAPTPDDEPVPATLDAPALLEHLHARLSALAAEVIDAVHPGRRSTWERTWEGLRLLVFEDWTMDDVLQRREGLPDDAPKRDRCKVRNRVYKAHERLRAALETAIVRRLENGSWTATDAILVQSALRHLLVRRQTKVSFHVSPVKAPLDRSTSSDRRSGDESPDDAGPGVN